MPVTDAFEIVDPDTIVINRGARQRRKVDTSELELSIQKHGVLNPIIVQRDLLLIAGERRLTACKKLGLRIPIRYFDTLSELEREHVQFEENEHRSDLPWQDRVNSIARIHALHSDEDCNWTEDQTASALGISQTTVSKACVIQPYITPKSTFFIQEIANAPGSEEALTRIKRKHKQDGDRAMNDIIAGQHSVGLTPILSNPSADESSAQTDAVKPAPEPPAIICADFLEWAPKFTGRPFNLIHCDFPYGGRVFDGRQMSDYSEVYEDDPKIYWALLKCLCENRGRLLTHHGFVVIWFSMIHYTETIRFLHKNASDLAVDPRPFVWLKSDNAGVCPDPRRKLRQTYETALLCRRNDAHYQNVVSNAYAAPTARQLHPSAKPQPVLTHFFRAMVDNHTRLLDPTCGSGTALCAADAMGAEYVFGMDVDKEHVENAISKLRSQRALAAVSKQMRGKNGEGK